MHKYLKRFQHSLTIPADKIMATGRIALTNESAARNVEVSRNTAEERERPEWTGVHIRGSEANWELAVREKGIITHVTLNGRRSETGSWSETGGLHN